jgi:N-formylglutamate amidohydrolase
MIQELRKVLLLGLSAIVVTTAAAQPPSQSTQRQGDPNTLVAIQEGQLPIILSAPHGGKEIIPDVPERKGEKLERGPGKFVTARDTGTEELAYQLAEALEKKMGQKPYYVVAKFHRKYIDANRPAEPSYEGPKAKPVYDLYHDSLAKFCKDVQKKHGRGLLLDLHGQGTSKETIYRGTQNGKTVKLLKERFGEKAVSGPESFFGLLAKQGWKAVPTDSSKETAGFTGGHIVQTYGSHTGYGIDAIQMEFGADYRNAANRAEIAKKLADVIDEFAKLYLKNERH